MVQDFQTFGGLLIFVSADENTVGLMLSSSDADATLGTSVGENGDTVYILSWERGGVSNTIMGNISRDEIVRIAENVF